MIHKKGIPLLVSPLLLRSYGLGQIDLAIFEKNELVKIFEVKSSIPVVSVSQNKRIKKAAEFIGLIFSAAVVLEIIN